MRLFLEHLLPYGEQGSPIVWKNIFREHYNPYIARYTRNFFEISDKPLPTKPPGPTPFQRNLLWAYQTAGEVAKYPELVDPELFAQAESYYQKGQRFQVGRGVGEASAAQLLYEEGYKFAGWSRGVRGRLARFPDPIGREFVSEWNRLALAERLTRAVRQGPFEDIPLESFYRNITARARTFGIQEQLATKLGTRAPELLSEMLFPTPWYQKVGRAVSGAYGATIGQPGVTAPRVAAGLAVLIAGLYLTKPLSLFSGKDDSYNTLEGLSHRGEAGRLRRLNTDFGSGWRGLFTRIRSYIGSFFRKQAGETARFEEILRPMSRTEQAAFYGRGEKVFGVAEIGKKKFEEYAYLEAGFYREAKAIRAEKARQAKRKSSLARAHKQGVKQASSYSLRPGRRHISQASKSVNTDPRGRWVLPE